MLNVALLLRHLLKVSDDGAGGQLVEHLLPGVLVSPLPAALLLSAVGTALLLRGPQGAEVHRDLPGHGLAPQQAVDDGAALPRGGGLLGLGAAEQVVWVCEVVPVQRGGGEQKPV